LWGVEMKEGLRRSRLKGLGELWIEFEGTEKGKKKKMKKTLLFVIASCSVVWCRGLSHFISKDKSFFGLMVDF